MAAISHFPATIPLSPIKLPENKKPTKRQMPEEYFGAGNGSRTRDLNLGKVALYQLSYSRKANMRYCSGRYVTVNR